MSTQVAEERRIVTAVVEKKGEGKRGHEAALMISEFGSKFPTLVNDIPDEDFPRLIIGKPAQVVLAKGNMQKKKDGTSYDGTQPWMFWWNWVGFAGEGQDAPFGPETSSAPAAPSTTAQEGKTPQRVTQGPTGWRESYAQSEECKLLERTSIERQKALDLAVQWCIKNEATDTYHVIVYAKRFAHFLKTGEMPPDLQAKKPAEA